MGTSAPLLDQIMPVADHVTAHEVLINAAAGPTFRALLAVDVARDPLVRWLLRARGLGARTATLDDARRMGFTELAVDENTEIVYGLIGRFWQLRGGIERLSKDDFSDYDQPGRAKVAWGFALIDQGGKTMLRTETRISCTDDTARRRFRRYWTVVRPFSSLIRTRMLALIKSSAELGGGAPEPD